jgi:sugar phosphate isomerase/epimerase
MTSLELELCWGTLPHLTVIEQIQVAAQAGFRAVTVSPSHYRRFVSSGEGTRATVRAALDDNGVRATILDCLMAELPGSPDARTSPPEYREMFAVGADECFAVLDDIGGSTLQVAHFQGHPTPLPVMVDAIGRLTERAKARGYTVVIEFLPRTGIPDFVTARSIVEAVGDPALEVMFDTWHFSRTGGDESELDGLVPGVVGALQVSDTPMSSTEMASLDYVPMSDRIVPGEGRFPLARVLATVLAGSGRLRVGIEVFSSRLRAMDPVDAATLVHRRTAGLLEQIGYEVGLTEPSAGPD